MDPSAVALAQPGQWTIGALINNIWSVAGPSDRSDVNQMLLQYFVNYNLKKGWYITSQPIIIANWKASSGNVWTVPFGGGVGRIMKLGFQPVNLSAQFYGNAVHPTSSPWGVRAQIAFLFPKLSPKRENAADAGEAERNAKGSVAEKVNTNDRTMSGLPGRRFAVVLTVRSEAVLMMPFKEFSKQ